MAGSARAVAIPEQALATSQAPPIRHRHAAPVHMSNQAHLRQLAGGIPSTQSGLTIGAVDDPLEREADAAADRVMRMADAQVSLSSPPAVNRKCAGCKDEDEEEHPLRRKAAAGAGSSGAIAPPSVHAVLGSPARRLDPATHDFMAGRFGADFSDVRIHSDAQAARSAEAVEARAYTVGRHVVFGAGQYDPASERGRRLLAHELTHVMQQSDGTLRLQRDPPAAAPPAAPPVLNPRAPPAAGGNILYIGMNDFPLEVAALKQRYSTKAATVTTVTRADDPANTATKEGTFDLTGNAGIDSFAAVLKLDAAHTKSVADLLKGQDIDDRDDLAHVIDVYAQTDGDGTDRMSRVVLSGHSGGTMIFGADDRPDAPTSSIKFETLVSLAGIFPKAAGQTKHLLVSACFAGAEDNLLRYYKKAYPSLQTFSGYTQYSPRDSGSAKAVASWAGKTDSNPTQLPAPAAGQSTWAAAGGYQGDKPSSGPQTMANLRADEATFNEYFAGTKVDPSSHSGWLPTYYARANVADLNVSVIVGADHDYVHLHAVQSYRLRFWKAQVAGFWKENAPAIRAGYGSATAPNYDTMSRKDALQAIDEFAGKATGKPDDVAKAKALLDALRNLDEKVMKGEWID